MPADPIAVLARYRQLKAERATFDARWEEMAPFVAPSRVRITTRTLAGGQKQTRGVYDSTTMLAAETMAMFVAGNIINPGQQWMSYGMSHPEVGDRDDVQEWLEECRDRQLAVYARSMFYAEGPESLIDWCGFGTGCLLGEEAPQPVNRVIQGFRGMYFSAQRTGHFVISEGADGLADTLMREFELTARVAKARWPTTSSQAVTMAAQKEPDRPFRFVHAIVPRGTADQHQAGALGMPWASLWMELEAKTLCHEGGYRMFPVAVPRFSRTAGEVYGRGRGDLAFPDTWSLNMAKKMGFEDWALKIRPPVFGRHDAVIGTLRLTPAGYTPVNTRGAPVRDALMAWETGSNPQVSQIKEEEIRRTIREIFYVDAIRQLLEMHKSEMSAFEYQKKLGLLFTLIGPTYGRFEREGLRPIVDIGFDVMLHAGAFSPPPPAVYATDGQIDVVFENPIARAQRAGDAEALLLVANDLAPFAQFFPQAWDRIDPDKTTSGVLRRRGFPARWTRSDDEVAALRAERLKHDEQANMMAQVGAAAQAAGQAAPLVKALSEKAGTQAGAAMLG